MCNYGKRDGERYSQVRGLTILVTENYSSANETHAVEAHRAGAQHPYIGTGIFNYAPSPALLRASVPLLQRHANASSLACR